MIIGIVGLIFSTILIINFSNLYLFLTDFCEKYLSQDNHIGPKMIFMIKIFIITGILLIVTISVIFILNLTRKVYKFILEFFQLNNSFAVKICRVKHLDLSILVIGTVLGLFQIYHLLTFGEPIGEFSKPSSEGMIEKIFSLLLLFSILILMISATKVKRDIYSSIIRRKIIFSIIIISGILLLILGEEISWGQRIFGWDSFGIFNEYNYQNETNAHNFFNPYVKYIYPIAGMGSFIVLFFIWLFPKKRENYFFNLLFPHPSLFFLVFLMAFSSFFGGGGETFEELFTIFVLLYSFRLFMCLSFPDSDLLPQEL
jgi:hypothetical protein